MTINSTAKRRIGSVATAGLGLGLAVGLLAAPAAAGFTYHPLAADSTVQIRTFVGKCLQIADSRTDNGAPVVQATCNGAPGQRWNISDGFAVNVNSGKCLEVPGWSKTQGTAIGQWDCNGGDNQRWGKVNVDGNTLAVVSFDSDLVLDVYGAGHDDGAPLVQWGGSRYDNERFTLAPVG
ncbi:RICIN domain-containing protein [Kitasatospora sp. NPDC059722]|uniref:RICIN domain-containing protein n=1 Tax=unclassified Kitasatospora TaxID=2633591 RepID=UPI0036833861